MRALLIGALPLSLLTVACNKAPQTEPSAAPSSEESAGGEEAASSSAAAPRATILVDPGAETPAPVSQAIAVLQPASGSNVHGTVKFQSADGELQVHADVQNLPPGAHAYHIHLLGDCSGEDAKTAGTHFNFQGSSENPPADTQRITGDLGNLEPGSDGSASAMTTLKTASLQGPYSIIGRAVVVHEKPNDPSQPPIGGAGGRIACGVIGIAD